MAPTRSKRKAKVIDGDSDSDDLHHGAYAHAPSKRAKKASATSAGRIEPTRRSERIQKQTFRFMDLPQELKDMGTF
jgi:hypothetical protein